MIKINFIKKLWLKGTPEENSLKNELLKCKSNEKGGAYVG